MFNFFRLVSLLEGASYLAILSVTLGFISRDFVSVIGMTHGALFILYLFSASAVSHQKQWSIVTFLLIFLASIVPFAFIGVEMFISRQQASQKSANV